MTRIYRYTIRTINGERHLIDAHDAPEAIRLSGIAPELIRPWYPFATYAHPTEEERTKTKERITAMKEKHTAQADRDEEIQRDAEARDCRLIAIAPTSTESNPFWQEPEHARTPKRKTTDQLLPAIPARTVPEAPLRSKKAQNSDPLPLETVYINASQGRLF